MFPLEQGDVRGFLDRLWYSSWRDAARSECEYEKELMEVENA